MTTTATNFETALDASPTDWALRLAYSDWLEDQGDEESLDLAAWMRWSARNEKAPRFVREDECHYGWRGKWNWFPAKWCGDILFQIGRDGLRVEEMEFRSPECVDNFEHLSHVGFKSMYPARVLAEADLWRVVKMKGLDK